LLAISVTLLVPDARAAVPTVDGPSVGRMHRVIIVDAGTPAAVKANSAKQPASSQAQTPIRARSAQPSAQSNDGEDQRPVRAATAR
jgi:hypothetical protein